MTQTTESFGAARQEAARHLHQARRIAVLGHVNPDADCIGSLLGLTHVLRALDKDVTPALSDDLPEYAEFLSGSGEIVSVLPPEAFDLFVFADSADIDRVGALYLEDAARFESAPLVNVDHHRTNPMYGTVNFVDPTASSTSELMYRLSRSLDVPISTPAATALLFGIVGDTGSFRNGATTPGSHEVAAKLLEAGADIQRIAFELFERKRFNAARLWGRILSDIELDGGRGIVFACLTQEMLAAEGATVDETEGVVEYLRGVEEASVVMLLKENEEGDVRVSMRSRPGLDVSAIACELGGGGHRQAAGCRIAGPLPAAKATLTKAFDSVIAR